MLEMSDSEEGTPVIARDSSGEPVRLFKNRQQLIEANLAGVKATAAKKEFAQQAFYNDNGSPLKRDFNDRGPVHRRLGKRVILRRNNGFQYGRRFAPYNPFGILRMKRTPQNFTQQGRLTQSREGITKYFTHNYMETIPRGVLMRQNNRWLERSAATQNITAGGSNNLNYTIEVPNNNCGVMETAITPYYPPQQCAVRHSIQAQLHPTLQEQIRSVQAECVSVSLFPIEIIPTLAGGATKIFMNDRFTALG